MNFSKKFLFLAMLAAAHVSYSQINGKVISANGPLVGVHILNQTNHTHSHSDIYGHFNLVSGSLGDTLIITHVGFSTEMVIANNLEKLLIQLTEQIIDLEEVYVSPKMDALNILTAINIKTNPVNSSQEILRKVPGLVIGQHAGGGKAEQIFLRGFDIDHGTDISISVDGIPVNMVSHAHGQGYADLHFLIPETINNLNFGKGPYNANKGNFATAGYVDLQTKNQLKNNQIKLEIGDFNTQRFLGMLQLLRTQDHNAYLATEYLLTDGPFDSPQNFSRLNIMSKYTGKVSSSETLQVIASHFTSTWNASGQIPQRAVDQGLINRFGTIDDTEGGQTSRSNIKLEYTKNIHHNTFVTSQFYYTHYQFELYSNFTFFLEDPINGDQIRQKENRDLFGLSTEINHAFHLGSIDGSTSTAIGFRSDMSHNNELSHTTNRAITLDTLQLGEIQEINSFAYTHLMLNFGKWNINPGLRIDQFNFNYTDALLPYQTQETQKVTISPKLNFLYNASNQLQLYLKTGKGFHSNDTRLITGNINEHILPATWGTDFGFIGKPSKSLLINTAVWLLYSQQEFVYVGDAGIVEPSGKSRRIGIDLSLRHQPLSWLFWNVDINYTLARAIEESDGNNYIPLAPDFTIMSGISVLHPSGIYGGLQLRHLDDRPANEDHSIVAKGYSIVDMNAGYQWRYLDFSLTIQNLLNTDWNETQFATESRLKDEISSTEEIHFTPGTPFYLKGSVSYKF